MKKNNKVVENKDPIELRALKHRLANLSCKCIKTHDSEWFDFNANKGNQVKEIDFGDFMDEINIESTLKAVEELKISSNSKLILKDYVRKLPLKISGEPKISSSNKYVVKDEELDMRDEDYVRKPPLELSRVPKISNYNKFVVQNEAIIDKDYVRKIPLKISGESNICSCIKLFARDKESVIKNKNYIRKPPFIVTGDPKIDVIYEDHIRKSPLGAPNISSHNTLVAKGKDLVVENKENISKSSSRISRVSKRFSFNKLVGKDGELAIIDREHISKLPLKVSRESNISSSNKLLTKDKELAAKNSKYTGKSSLKALGESKIYNNFVAKDEKFAMIDEDYIKKLPVKVSAESKRNIYNILHVKDEELETDPAMFSQNVSTDNSARLSDSSTSATDTYYLGSCIKNYPKQENCNMALCPNFNNSYFQKEMMGSEVVPKSFVLERYIKCIRPPF